MGCEIAAAGKAVLPPADGSDTLGNMSRFVLAAVAAVFGLSFLSAPVPAAAQGLLWALPDDGTAAIYAGSYRQVIRRTGSTQQDVELTFNRELRVRSVGGETIDTPQGPQPHRWIEFEAITRGGEAVAGDDGDVPGRTTIVKLLVPESFIDGRPLDDRDIPKTTLPYTRGYLQRDRGEVIELPAGGSYQPYPELTLLRMSRPLAQEGDRITAEETLESRTSRTELKTTINRDPQAPFGLGSWTVVTKDSVKEVSEPREAFRETSESTEEMSLSRVESGAISAIDRD